MDEPPTVTVPGPAGAPREPRGDETPSGAFVPFQFGKYRIERELGRGGMGVVYEAVQTDLDRRVAIKMILGHHLSVPGFAERFHAEARAAARVNHPNVVSIYETGSHHAQHYIAMEFVAGRPLSQLLADDAVTLRDATRYVAQIARAVHYLHGHHILHRDLKPSNIMVTAEGRPLLLDFGLAEVRDTPHGLAAGVVGTPGYVAPEIIEGVSARASEAADVYSLGATLYEVAAGRAPFVDTVPVQAFLAALKQDPAPPRSLRPGVPLALQTIILKCLEREPAARYATAEALAADLDRFLLGEPIAATPPPGLVRVRRWIRGHPALAARVFSFAGFFLLATWNLWMGLVDAKFYESMALWLGLWTIGSAGCDFAQLRWRYPTRVTWTVLDALAMTMVLLAADGVASPLILAFPLWIAISGFWYRISITVATAVLALASYATIALCDASKVSPDKHLVFASVVVLTATVIGMQVRRARAITEFLDRRG